jgi:hypothetical protein
LNACDHHVHWTALAQHEDRKIAGAVYHFLSSTPQQLRSDGLTNVRCAPTRARVVATRLSERLTTLSFSN